MADTKKPKKDPNFYVKDDRTGEMRPFPKKSSFWSATSEGFERTNMRDEIAKTRKIYENEDEDETR